jgi:predicted DNA-binding protein (MmcQ/YjbR family)
MKYDWIEDYCLSKKGTEKEYKAEWEALLYKVGGKMFVMQGKDNEGRSIITIKLEPPFGEFLRSQYVDIRPGYYMNKQHWNSVDANGSVPDDVLKNMLDQSYELVLHSLTKKVQNEINSD